MCDFKGSLEHINSLFSLVAQVCIACLHIVIQYAAAGQISQTGGIHPSELSGLHQVCTVNRVW